MTKDLQNLEQRAYEFAKPFGASAESAYHCYHAGATQETELMRAKLEVATIALEELEPWLIKAGADSETMDAIREVIEELKQ